MWPADDNPLHNGPAHGRVDRREVESPVQPGRGCVPGRYRGVPKVWPPVRRIDGAKGDRNLVCSCPPMEAYAG